MKKEIEIQVNIENTERLIDYLSCSAEFIREIKQTDRYFFNGKNIKDRPIKEWLRLRYDGGQNFVTYKKLITDNRGDDNYWQEYETVIGSADVLSVIFENMGLNKTVTVAKNRKVWILGDYEISMDNVENLGDFVEVEYIGSVEMDSEQIKNEMVMFLKKIGCGSIKKNSVGYPFQLMFPDEVEFEVM